MSDDALVGSDGGWCLISKPCGASGFPAGEPPLSPIAGDGGAGSAATPLLVVDRLPRKARAGSLASHMLTKSRHLMATY